MIIWLTGLSGAGKTTIAKELAMNLSNPVILDGDRIRELGVVSGFDRLSRYKNIVFIAKLAKMLEEQGLEVIVSAISPHEDARKEAFRINPDMRMFYISTPLEVCIERDVKGLYEKAIKGEIPLFTGLQDDYEVPENAIRIETGGTVYRSVDKIMGEL